MLASLLEKADIVRAEYERRRGRFEQLSEMRRRKASRLSEVEREVARLEKVADVFRAASEAARERARQKVERVVTDALRAVFGPGVEFAAEIVDRRGRPEVEFSIISDYGGAYVRTPVLDARGGGVVDVVSLALRVLVAVATSPPQAPVLLDEPGKHLSEGYSRALGELLKAVARETGRQIVVVTHDPRLAEAADAVYRVEMAGGESRVSKVAGNCPNIELKEGW